MMESVQPRRNLFVLIVKKVLRFLISQVGLTFVVVAYSILGAVIIQRMEQPVEVEVRMSVKQLRLKYAEKLWEKTRDYADRPVQEWTARIDGDLKRFQRDIYNSIKTSGWDGRDIDEDLEWSFVRSVLFTITVITTIGYGDITPQSTGGRYFTILYAVIGIPLLLLCMANVGNLLARIFRLFYCSIIDGNCSGCRNNYICRKCRLKQKADVTLMNNPVDFQTAKTNPKMDSPETVTMIRQAISQISEPTETMDMSICSADRISLVNVQPENSNMAESSETPEVVQYTPEMVVVGNQGYFKMADDSGNPAAGKYEPETVRECQNQTGSEGHVPLGIICLVMVFYISLGATLFSYWEDWSYSESCYFCFITLSTIGFGDYVPGTSEESWKSQAKRGFCALYLLFGLTILAMCFSLAQDQVVNFFRRLGITMRLLSDSDN